MKSTECPTNPRFKSPFNHHKSSLATNIYIYVCTCVFLVPSFSPSNVLVFWFLALQATHSSTWNASQWICSMGIWSPWRRHVAWGTWVCLGYPPQLDGLTWFKRSFPAGICWLFGGDSFRQKHLVADISHMPPYIPGYQHYFAWDSLAKSPPLMAKHKACFTMIDGPNPHWIPFSHEFYCISACFLLESLQNPSNNPCFRVISSEYPHDLSIHLPSPSYGCCARDVFRSTGIIACPKLVALPGGRSSQECRQKLRC